MQRHAVPAGNFDTLNAALTRLSRSLLPLRSEDSSGVSIVSFGRRYMPVSAPQIRYLGASLPCCFEVASARIFWLMVTRVGEPRRSLRRQVAQKRRQTSR